MGTISFFGLIIFIIGGLGLLIVAFKQNIFWGVAIIIIARALGVNIKPNYGDFNEND
ncbi:hypothetical protein [Zhongshania arctica]|uniref:Uncharacterized protein n=1 Tax=Zhongshania arctica TaxID=3238302 RepID=A0ABV3TRV3_9GAMM